MYYVYLKKTKYDKKPGFKNYLITKSLKLV